MSVLAAKRTVSKAQYVNKANEIYTETIRFLTRQKMKSFKKKTDEGTITIEQIEQWYQTIIAYFENYNDHNRILRLNRIYYNLFGGVPKCSKSLKTVNK